MRRYAFGLTALALTTAASSQDCPQWVLHDQSPPSDRLSSSAAFDGDGVIIFGGWNGTTLGDTWRLDEGGWTQVATNGPAANENVGLAWDSARECVILFGGTTPISNETWEWRSGAWTQLTPRTVPPATGARNHLAYDSWRQRIVMFGGWNPTDEFLGTTWEWDGANWNNMLSTGPAARASTALAFDETRGVTVLFGGADGNSLFADTWEWDGAVWTHRDVPGPSARRDHAMAYDESLGGVVLFGGRNHFTGEWYDDTWLWNGSQWTLLAASGPVARSQAAMQHDPIRRRTVLVGGTWDNQTSTSDTWELFCPSTYPVDIEILTGVLLEGGVVELLESDDEVVVTRSGFGNSLADLHKMDMLVHLRTDVQNPTTIDMTVESRISEPSGIARVSLLDWSTGVFSLILQHAAGTSDVIATANGIDASDFVNDENEITVLFQHLVFVPFLAFTFESFVDLIQIEVE